MNWDAIRVGFEVGQFLITGGVAVYLYFVTRGDAVNKRITSVEKTVHGRLDDHLGRIAKLEQARQDAPTHNDVTSLREDVAGLKSEAVGQTELLRRLTTQVDRINEWLIDRAK